MDEFNPYAAPKAEVVTQDSEAEAIRRKHINHEASIKSVGCLYWLAALLLCITLAVCLANIEKQTAGWLALLLGLAVLTAVVGRGLRKLQRWAGIVAALWAGVSIVFGIMNLPSSSIGMVIAAYIIYLMVGAKGRRVLSAEYRDIVLQTPHVKRRTSIVVWVLLGLLLAIVAFGILGAMRP